MDEKGSKKDSELTQSQIQSQSQSQSQSQDQDKKETQLKMTTAESLTELGSGEKRLTKQQ